MRGVGPTPYPKSVPGSGSRSCGARAVRRLSYAPRLPEAESQNKPPVNAIPRQGPEQVLQPETASDSGSVASSELVEGLSLEKDAAGGIEEPALIEDFPAESILSDPKEKEDLLDIPAFLRRQAN